MKLSHFSVTEIMSIYNEWADIVDYYGDIPPQSYQRPIARYANERKWQDVVRLLKQGADPNCYAANGMTPLMIAVSTVQLEVVVLLILFGANVNAQMEDGATALTMCLHDYDRDIYCDIRVYEMRCILYRAPRAQMPENRWLRYRVQDAFGVYQARRTARRACMKYIGPRATEICFALESLALPAPLTIAIIEYDDPIAERTLHWLKWKIVTTIKRKSGDS